MEEEGSSDLFASPSEQPRRRQALKESPTDEKDAPRSEETHEENLQRELASLRSLNTVISGITASLHKARENTTIVAATVDNASSLLATWTRILSQTEHNQRLILDPAWQGATHDISELESEELQRQQLRQRQQAEDELRAQQHVTTNVSDTSNAPIGASGRGASAGRRGTRGLASRASRGSLTASRSAPASSRGPTRGSARSASATTARSRGATAGSRGRRGTGV